MYEKTKDAVIIGSHYDLVEYCKDNNQELSKFNEPVIIRKDIKNCSYMFGDCSSFNQPVQIPKGVKDCSCMFDSCSSFNQPVQIPKGVKDCSGMFDRCPNMNADGTSRSQSFSSHALTTNLFG